MTKKSAKWNLGIDTTDFGKIVFSLDDGKKKIQKDFSVRPQESDKILEYLGQFLKTNKILHPKSYILNLLVYKGKGSFTGLRIAAAIAQALSLAWGVPVKVASK